MLHRFKGIIHPGYDCHWNANKERNGDTVHAFVSRKGCLRIRGPSNLCMTSAVLGQYRGMACIWHRIRANPLNFY